MRSTTATSAGAGARVRTARAVALALAFGAVACGSSDGDVETGRGDAPSTIDAGVGAAAVAAGELTADDLNAPPDADRWAVTDWDEANEDVAACLDLAGVEGDPGVVASGRSVVFDSEDERGPTSIFVTAESVTIAYGSSDQAAAAFAEIDEPAVAACISASTDVNVVEGEEGDSVDPVSPDAVGVQEVRPVDAGDEALALRATYDQDFGEGDDNSSAAELHAVRIGPVVQLVWTTRGGEDQPDGVVDAETLGLGDVVIALSDRVSAALGDG